MKKRQRLEKLKRAYANYDRFMEKQGFGIVLTACVLIIVSSAVYTFHFRQKWSIVVKPDESIHVETVDSQDVQTLLEAQELITSQRVQPLPSSTELPLGFELPVDGFLDRDFDMKTPQFFAKPNYFRLHPGIDLQADYGTPVKACAAGQIIRVWQDNELGLCVRIRHLHDYEAVYAGLCDAGYVKVGDRVERGQTIGHVGNGVVAESDAEPHLHLEVWNGETAVDPIQLFLGLT